MGGEPGARPGDGRRDLGDDLGRHAGLSRGELECVVTVEAAQDLLEPLERGLGPRVFAAEILRPVPPAADELTVVAAGLDQMAGDSEQDRRL